MVKVVQKHGVHNPNFKGFMVDSAQANFNVVWRIFGYGNPTISIVDKKKHVSYTGFNPWRSTQ